MSSGNNLPKTLDNENKKYDGFKKYIDRINNWDLGDFLKDGKAYRDYDYFDKDGKLLTDKNGQLIEKSKQFD